MRERLTVPINAAEDDVRARALEALEKRGVKIAAQRVIFVPKKFGKFRRFPEMTKDKENPTMNKMRTSPSSPR